MVSGEGIPGAGGGGREGAQPIGEGQAAPPGPSLPHVSLLPRQTTRPFPSPCLPAPSTDYQTLRIGGLVFAVVFFSVGILLILSKSLCSPWRSMVSAQCGERAAWEPVVLPVSLGPTACWHIIGAQ